ncbi:uncharacterized protein FFMR_13284 [Fusarium fujikuroi]|nr:uncharacterized protein FFMR_13284 [Fusarium fujikuroi]
MAIINIRPP